MEEISFRLDWLSMSVWAALLVGRIVGVPLIEKRLTCCFRKGVQRQSGCSSSIGAVFPLNA